jgi:ectoine hydroxylase-related dioxygenase (phytanoyl-CoA dioxygenase family)
MLAGLRSFVQQMARHPDWGLVQNFVGRPRWQRVPNEVPWTDRPDALERLDEKRQRGEVGAQLAGWLEKWIRDGYVVLDGIVEARDLDQMNAALDGLWEAPRARRGLTFYDVRADRKEAPRTLSHAQLLAHDRELRRRMQRVSNWRIHAFHRHDPAAMRLYANLALRKVASAVFGRQAIPCASINFAYGSEQPPHQDMAVFHIYPHNYLAGAWVACEDISPDCGPLAFHPGSHREPLFDEFRGYPQVNLRTVGPDVAARYDEYMKRLVEKYPRKLFLAKKGQVLLWHGMLIHGGSPIHDPALTRRSYVVHFHARHADRAQEVLGPFNWS